MPVSNAALRKASRRTSSDGRFRRVQGIVENDGALGQRAGLVGAQNIHAAEVLDRFQAADDDATPAHGPGAGGQGHADDRRQQLRRQTDRERNGKQEGLDHRATEKQIHRQDEQDDDDHHADQQISELAHAAREIRLGRAGSEPCRDRPERSPATGFDDEDLRRAASDRGAEKDCICPSRKGRLRLHDPGLLFDGKRLARHARFADQEVLRLDHQAIGRDQIACREQDEVAGHDSAHGHRPLDAVPHDTASQRQSAFQLLDCRRRPVLLKEAEQRASEHDRQNDGRIHPLLQHQRDRSGEDEDEDERALELPQKQSKRAQVRRVFNAVGADQAKLRGGFLRRKAAGARPQRCA